jgi:hypothetical protein
MSNQSLNLITFKRTWLKRLGKDKHSSLFGYHDPLHNDVYHNDTRRKDIQHINIQHTNEKIMTVSITVLNTVMLSVANKPIMLSVIILNGMAPLFGRTDIGKV